MLPAEPLRTAVVQMRSTADRDANLERAARLLDEAVRAGASLVVLPENFGFLDREGRKIDVAESPDDGAACGMARQAALRNRVWIAAGTVPLVAPAGRVTNSLLVWSPDGRLTARYDKMHLFDIELDPAHSFRESRFVAPGERVVTTDVEGWRLGLSVCYDLRFPELYRSLVDEGAHALLVPAAFTARTGRDHWEVLLRARAIENQCWVVAAAQWGHHGADRESWGRSMIVDPWGGVAARVDEGEGIAVADLEPGVLGSVRKAIPCLEHRRIRTGSLRPDPSASPSGEVDAGIR